MTGPEAIKAQKKASVLESHLDRLQAIIIADKSGVNIKEHIKKIIELTDDISHAVISSWKKVCFLYIYLYIIHCLFCNHNKDTIVYLNVG